MFNIKCNLFLFVSIVILFASCRKDPPVYPDGLLPIDPNADIGAYQPLTKGSFWTYSSTQNDVEYTTTTTLTGNTRVFSSNIFWEGETVAAGAETRMSYYYYGDHQYILKDDDFFEGANTELVYLNDTASVGYSWTQSLTIAEMPARFLGSIKERGITKTVNGRTFKNVIHTTVLLQYQLTGAYETYATYDFYIAKNVGVIETDTMIDMLGVKFESSLVLKDYSIK
ncbi:hypothetical protein F1649_17475 [Arcticibacter tournemirensis]|uniref:Uncharacterized protein n=1 Tax=Arcticibacter tournemirensis TaxID=699437 RepID=A0A5M9GYP0_9SPHI|nr:hypothetical protein [Arcticibacter tournemirensis]KAA8478497.1 hypothetical protein F1649_17475 [Arcticibacter tournemirensis]